MSLIQLLAALLLGGGGVCARAAAVQVLDDNRHPMTDVLVTCMGQEQGAALTGPDGIATLPDTCRRVSCSHGGFVTGEAHVDGARAVCRISRGVVVLVALPTPGCGEDCSVGLYRPEGAIGGASGAVEQTEDSWTARVGPVAVGTYELDLARWEDGWMCGAMMTFSEAGEHRVRGVWREPLALRGIVLRADGGPGVDVPVRVRDSKDDHGRPEGKWHCRSSESAPDEFTRPDGTFTLRVDREGSLELEAGSPWDPDGHAVVEVPAGQSGPVEVHLIR